MRRLNLAAVLALSVLLGGCTASVSTFSASIAAPGAAPGAAPDCDASVRGRAVTSELTLAPGGGARTTDERSDLCLRR